MKVFFIEYENGDYYSTDGNRRFTKMTGDEARIFLKKERKAGRNRKFLLTETEERDVDELYDEIYVEIPMGSVSIFRKPERRKQYVKDCEENSKIETISYNAPLRDQEDLTIEDVVSDCIPRTHQIVTAYFRHLPTENTILRTSRILEIP